MACRIIGTTLSLTSASMLRVNVNNNTLSVLGSKARFGSSKCPCVGFDNVGGTTDVTVEGQVIKYPGDLGARCDEWDKDISIGCKGANPEEWCKEQWCYVDPCNCDIPEIPKVSSFMPEAKYQGKTLYYSYETCGGKDGYTEAHHKKACVNQKTKDTCGEHSKCLWNEKEGKCGGKDVMSYCMRPLPVNTWGESNCKCVGIHGQEGTVEVHINDQTHDFPASIGSTCKDWDMGRHPECKGADAPAWCTDRWCYVDPCSCGQDIPPTASNYMPGATFQGKPIHFSYATCGTENRFSDTHDHEDKSAELAKLCSSAWTFTPVIAFVLSWVTM